MFISRPPIKDVGYDLLVGFSNDKAGVNTFSVEVKSTEEPPSELRFPIPRSVFNRIAHSNVPGLLLVADVKRNQLYYAWLTSGGSNGGGHTVSIPVVEISETTKKKLKNQLRKANGVEAAGAIG